MAWGHKLSKLIAHDLGALDFVSGGAITDATLLCLHTISHISGTVRIIENTKSDYSNHRYALLKRSQDSQSKVETLLDMDADNLKLQALHMRYDDQNDAPIPTIAFVSFWAGLLLTTYLIRSAAGEKVTAREQQIFLTPLRPESVWRSAVGRRPDCPICSRAIRAA